MARNIRGRLDRLEKDTPALTSIWWGNFYATSAADIVPDAVGGVEEWLALRARLSTRKTLEERRATCPLAARIAAVRAQAKQPVDPKPTTSTSGDSNVQ